MAIPGFTSPYPSSSVPWAFTSPVAGPRSQGEPPAPSSTSTPPLTDSFSRLSNTALFASPAFLATSPVNPGIAQPAFRPNNEASPAPAVAASAAPPQVIYVPVLQAPIQPAASTKPDTETPAEPALKSGPSRKPELPELLEPPPVEEGTTPNAQQIGYQVGKAVEKILGDDPELLAAAERLNLDDPNLLLKGVHDAIAPAVNWMPDLLKNKIVDRIPLEHQDLAQRFLDWLDKPMRLPAGGERGPQSASQASKPTREASEGISKRGSSARVLREEPKHTHRDLSSLDDLFLPDAELIDEKPSLRERLNPLNHLPLPRKDKSSSLTLDDLLA
jgi:hypothetical protein